MKLTPSEETLIRLMRENGGSICPGGDQSPGHELQRIIRRLERKGVLSVEQTDDGYRYSVREGMDG